MFVFLAALAVTTAPAVGASQPLATGNNVCLSQNAAFTEDDLSGITSPCAAAPGTLLVETLYFQNASRSGGTALAAYPLVRLRTGIAHHLEVVLDTPSQIAESGQHGVGLYPVTRLGFGLNYTIASNARSASGFGVETQPPSSRFNVDERQPKYAFDYSYSYNIGRRGSMSAIAFASSSHLVGFGRIAPAAALRYAYDASARTQISTDIGARVVARGARAQAYTDLALKQRLRENISYTFGLGTTFNGMIGAGKAHYMASGFNFHLR